LAFLEGFAGRVIVDAKVATDGRVADATVEISSGHRALDAAALRSVRASRFNVATDAAALHDRKARIPINFSMGGAASQRVVLLGAPDKQATNDHRPALQWPAGYLHPRYAPAAVSMPFDAALATVRALAHLGPPVAGGARIYAEFVEDGSAGDPPKVIWFALDPGKPWGMLVRYTFSGAPANPVVTVATACPGDSPACMQAMPELLRGPFFARAATTATAAAKGN
jgi:TonB family protein